MIASQWTQMIDRGGNSLVRWSRMEPRCILLSVAPSVSVHVVRSLMVVVEADRLPLAVYEQQQGD